MSSSDPAAQLEHKGLVGDHVEEVDKPTTDGTLASGKPTEVRAATKLGQWSATAICGNDITSSCLYVAALCIMAAGYLAPLSLLIVVVVLYFYRKIYAEVGDALPLNGGAYNCLLNSTTKFWASIAACMTIVSYIATAVISAKTAVSYVAYISGFEHNLPLILGITVGVLAVFAMLTIIGIGESSRVALAIFIFHMTTLFLFSIFGIVAIISDTSTFQANLSAELPDGHGVGTAIFFGFAAALLGISGFESSANFIEEQAEGVFVKTLRNMWIAVSVFNPLMAILALGILPVSALDNTNYDYLLSLMANRMAGQWLAVLVSINAAFVLCGAVLTSFVGVTGLVRRMSLDRCLPQYLLKENHRGTNHRIILAFFLLSSSILLLTRGRVETLAGLYAIAFLGVMSLFAVGNILLKLRRSRLKRRYRASTFWVIIALAATIMGLLGNIIRDVDRFWFFLTYFVPTVVIVGIMFWRIRILRLFLIILRSVVTNIDGLSERITDRTGEMIDEINSAGAIFFTRGDNVSNLNLAVLYVRTNEETNNLKFIHVYQNKDTIPARLKADVELLNEVYPDIQIELILREGRFGPALIEELSDELGIPKNYMFIGAPGEQFPHQLADLGGVRLII